MQLPMFADLECLSHAHTFVDSCTRRVPTVYYENPGKDKWRERQSQYEEDPEGSRKFVGGVLPVLPLQAWFDIMGWTSGATVHCTGKRSGKANHIISIFIHLNLMSQQEAVSSGDEEGTVFSLFSFSSILHSSKQ